MLPISFAQRFERLSQSQAASRLVEKSYVDRSWEAGAKTKLVRKEPSEFVEIACEQIILFGSGNPCMFDHPSRMLGGAMNPDRLVLFDSWDRAAQRFP